MKGLIAEVRGLPEGTAAISPPRFPDWNEVSQIKDFADEVRSRTGGRRAEQLHQRGSLSTLAFEQVAHHREEHPRPLDRTRQDVEGGDGDRGRIAEPAECLLRLQDPGNQQHDHRPEDDHGR